jgi:hypothetical protein
MVISKNNGNNRNNFQSCKLATFPEFYIYASIQQPNPFCQVTIHICLPFNAENEFRHKVEILSITASYPPNPWLLMAIKFGPGLISHLERTPKGFV